MKLKTGKLSFKAFEEPKEEDIYTEQGLYQKTDDDGITSGEEGFMAGWLSC